jgi:hypothetical protein
MKMSVTLDFYNGYSNIYNTDMSDNMYPYSLYSSTVDAVISTVK